LLFDDGTQDNIPTGSEGWDFSPGGSTHGHWVDQVIEGSARFVLLHSGSDDALAAYDIRSHTLARLGALPTRQPPMPMPGSPFVPPPPTYVYDDLQERVWFCGDQVRTVSLRSGDAQELPFGCSELHHQGGSDLLVQAPDGAVYALAADGSAATPLGQFPLHGIRAASGRTFLYVRSPSEDFGHTFSAFIGDTRVVRGGMSPRFSADGQRLYWLEDVAFSAGDLWSFDLASAVAHPLVRNVSEFDLLPDGRLVAIANAALAGPFNRAVLVDEKAGQSRWLATNAQSLKLFGDQVIVERKSGATQDFYRVPLPPQ
jgi:hypothetical protein